MRSKIQDSIPPNLQDLDPVSLQNQLSYTDKELIAALNFAIAEAVLERPADFQRTKEWALQDPSISYELPGDCVEVESIRIDSYEVAVYHPAQYPSDATNIYAIIQPHPGGFFKLYNVEADADSVVKIIYICTPPQVTSIDDDIVENHPAFANAVITLAAKEIFVWKQQPNPELERQAMRLMTKYADKAEKNTGRLRIITIAEKTGFYARRAANQHRL